MACHYQAFSNYGNLIYFCFHLLKQHRHNFENDSGGGVVRTQQLLLSSASAELILEDRFGRLNLKNYTGAILQTQRDWDLIMNAQDNTLRELQREKCWMITLGSKIWSMHSMGNVRVCRSAGMHLPSEDIRVWLMNDWRQYS